RLVVQHALVLVEVLNKLSDAAAIIKLVRLLRFLALVMNRDANSLVEEGFFTQTLRQFVETKFNRIENLGVGPKGDLRATFASFTCLFERCDGNAPFVFLFVSQPVTPDFEVKCLSEEIHARDTNAMQSA